MGLSSSGNVIATSDDTTSSIFVTFTQPGGGCAYQAVSAIEPSSNSTTNMVIDAYNDTSNSLAAASKGSNHYFAVAYSKSAVGPGGGGALAVNGTVNYTTYIATACEPLGWVPIRLKRASAGAAPPSASQALAAGPLPDALRRGRISRPLALSSSPFRPRPEP